MESYGKAVMGEHMDAGATRKNVAIASSEQRYGTIGGAEAAKFSPRPTSSPHARPYRSGP